jgi:hypothetical protein
MLRVHRRFGNYTVSNHVGKPLSFRGTLVPKVECTQDYFCTLNLLVRIQNKFPSSILETLFKPESQRVH